MQEKDRTAKQGKIKGWWQQIMGLPCIGRRLAGIVLGNLLMGFAVTLLRMSHFGNDPFSCMNLGYSIFSNLSFGLCVVLCNCVLILWVIRKDLSYIHIGILVNMFLLGVISDAFYSQLTLFWGSPDTYDLSIRCILLAAGILISCYGCSAYVCANLGMGPYDAIGWIVDRSTKQRIPFRYFRIGMDTIAALIGFMLGSIVGPGTIIMALFTGPLISFFNEKINMRLIYGPKESKKGQYAVDVSS